MLMSWVLSHCVQHASKAVAKNDNGYMMGNCSVSLLPRTLRKELRLKFARVVKLEP